MYNNTPNLGLGSIAHVLETEFQQIHYERYDVRAQQQIPGIDHDIFISSGGPGHPLDGIEQWGESYLGLLDHIVEHNRVAVRKKFVLFICHSFQIACHHFKVGKITRRKKDSFGIFPLLKTEEGLRDHLFEYLPQPFYAADFRSYQVTRLQQKQLARIGARVLATEHPRHQVYKTPALMAVRFTPEMYGFQFHPEAYPRGMSEYFMDPKRKKQIVKEHGRQVYEEMMFHMRDPLKIGLTHRKLLPGFLQYACHALEPSQALAS